MHMLIPIIPHNLKPFYQIEPAIFESGSATNASARLPIGGPDSEGFFSCPAFLRPFGKHAECSLLPDRFPSRLPSIAFVSAKMLFRAFFPQAVHYHMIQSRL